MVGPDKQRSLDSGCLELRVHVHVHVAQYSMMYIHVLCYHEPYCIYIIHILVLTAKVYVAITMPAVSARVLGMCIVHVSLQSLRLYSEDLGHFMRVLAHHSLHKPLFEENTGVLWLSMQYYSLSAVSHILGS